MNILKNIHVTILAIVILVMVTVLLLVTSFVAWLINPSYLEGDN